MSLELRGLPAAPGVASGAPWIHRPTPTDAIPGRSIADAAAMAAAELDTLASRLRDEGRPDEAGILEAQSMMAADPELLGSAANAESSGMPPVAAISVGRRRGGAHARVPGRRGALGARGRCP